MDENEEYYFIHHSSFFILHSSFYKNLLAVDDADTLCWACVACAIDGIEDSVRLALGSNTWYSRDDRHDLVDILLNLLVGCHQFGITFHYLGRSVELGDVRVMTHVGVFVGDALYVGVFVHDSHAFVVSREVVFEVGLAGSQRNDSLQEYVGGSSIFGRGGGSKMGVFIDSFFELVPQFFSRFIDAVDVGGGGIIKRLSSRQCLLESTLVDLCCGRSGNDLHATDDESVPTVTRRVDVQNVVRLHIHIEVEFVCQRTLHLLVGGFIEHSSRIQSCLRKDMVLSVL